MHASREPVPQTEPQWRRKPAQKCPICLCNPSFLELTSFAVSMWCFFDPCEQAGPFSTFPCQLPCSNCKKPSAVKGLKLQTRMRASCIGTQQRKPRPKMKRGGRNQLGHCAVLVWAVPSFHPKMNSRQFGKGFLWLPDLAVGQKWVSISEP